MKRTFIICMVLLCSMCAKAQTYDLNGDGKTDAADVAFLVDKILTESKTQQASLEKEISDLKKTISELQKAIKPEYPKELETRIDSLEKHNKIIYPYITDICSTYNITLKSISLYQYYPMATNEIPAWEYDICFNIEAGVRPELCSFSLGYANTFFRPNDLSSVIDGNKSVEMKYENATLSARIRFENYQPSYLVLAPTVIYGQSTKQSDPILLTRNEDDFTVQY